MSEQRLPFFLFGRITEYENDCYADVAEGQSRELQTYRPRYEFESSASATDRGNSGGVAIVGTRTRYRAAQGHAHDLYPSRDGRHRIALAGVCVLIVEDQPLIALDLPALLHHRVPFLFHTGHANARMLRAWPEVP